MSKTVEISDLSDSLDREPTSIIKHFSEWLQDKTGFDPGEATPEEAWLQGIKLSSLHRGDFQRSPENRAARVERAERRKSEAEERKAETERRRAEKAEAEKARADAKAEREAAKTAKAERAEQAKAEKSAKGSVPKQAKATRGSKKQAPEDKPEAAGEVAGDDDSNVTEISKPAKRKTSARRKSESAPSPF